ncbi:ATP-binding protein [Candidatus Roizmanbacteria bacterium]|nr:MAG: ATP-binding protein [Candidatus Roizmanbacteria bacterium]
MANIKIVEAAIRSYIEGNNIPLIDVLDKEIVESKKRGNHHKVKRLKELLKLLPNKQKYIAQTNSFANSFQTELSPLYQRVISNIPLESVVLNKFAQETISRLLSEWEKYEMLARHNIYPTNKLLLYGPPGTGKTMLAYALAYKLNMPLILVRLDEVISSYLGKTGKNIREIFHIAEKENVVILLDEIDTIAKNRDDERELGELKRVVTVLLQNIDNFPNNSILIGATNHESILDKAIWRRFTIKVQFDNPSEELRKLLFKHYLEGFKSDIDLSLISKLSEGLNGSAIKDICVDIKKRVVLSGKSTIRSVDAIQVILLMSNYANSQNKIPKKKYYSLCKILRQHGMTLSEISSISDIPYTTLRDNL